MGTLAFVYFSFFFIYFFLATCARLSWSHSAFECTLNSSIVSCRCGLCILTNPLMSAAERCFLIQTTLSSSREQLTCHDKNKNLFKLNNFWVEKKQLFGQQDILAFIYATIYLWGETIGIGLKFCNPFHWEESINQASSLIISCRSMVSFSVFSKTHRWLHTLASVQSACLRRLAVQRRRSITTNE